MIRIPLERQLDIKQFLKNIFKTCDLPVENVEKIQIKKKPTSVRFSADAYPDAPIYDEYEIYSRTMQTKQAKTLK